MFAPAGPEPIVAIKAGKCKVEPHRDEAKRAAGKLWITPQKDRGEVIVVKKDDTVHLYRADQAIDVFEDGLRIVAHGTFTKPVNWADFLTTIETHRVPLES